MKKAIRIITFNKKQEHTAPLFTEIEILPLDSCIKLKQANFIWKLNHNLLPHTIMENFTIHPFNIIKRANKQISITKSKAGHKTKTGIIRLLPNISLTSPFSTNLNAPKHGRL